MIMFIKILVTKFIYKLKHKSGGKIELDKRN